MGYGGAEKNIETLLKHFASDSKLFLVLLEPVIQYDIPPHVQIVPLHNTITRRHLVGFILFLPFLVYRYLKFCRQNQIRTSYSLLNKANLLNAVAYRWNNSIRFIVSEHCPYTDLFSQLPPITRWLKERILRFINSNAHCTQVVSNGIAHELREVYHCKNPMELIYNPIDEHRIRQQAGMEENFLFDSSLRYWIHVGNFHPYKNHRLLVDAFARMKEEQDRLLLIGSGSMLEDIKKRVNELGLNQQVLFLGQQKNPYYYIARSFCLVLTSELEGLSNVILEALCLGKPVISTDCPYGPREIMLPGSAPETGENIIQTPVGFLVPNKNPSKLSDAMIQMAKWSEISTFQKNALLRADDFMISKIAGKYQSLFSNSNP